ncbi:bifunctional diguanylate cyclase/phosphodiesterase [Demequina sp. NBRC 110052]|uniref:putative bifunctional diguanylate cyclase/phosphodiesterase n=1 Tax=Demequina sp. NBRC 110052 TaxID=1570341 RepID=UPI0013564975|nr:bifunctional diguanylate cyclase/phosphodiesterase [Demequina sp. NBRC 110052]
MEVGLTTPDREGGAPEKSPAPPSHLALYLLLVGVAGIGGVVAVTVRTPWADTLSAIPWWPVVVMGAAAIAGELRPIKLVLAGAETRRLSTSAPFVLALIPIAGITVAVLVQIVASIADDALHRRELRKSIFNTSQYAVSVLTAGLVFTALSGERMLAGPIAFDVAHLPALLAAGVAMVAVNWVLVATVVSLAMRVPLAVVLRSDAKHSFFTHLVLLSVGGIAALVADDGVGALALLAAPTVAAHMFSAAAARNAHEATHDTLTGLANRSQMEHALSRLLGQGGDVGPTLVLIDLDHFKDFNDTLGHPVGDRILQEVANKLAKTTPPEASVHRLGGDEFAVVIDADADEARVTTLELLGSLDHPLEVGDLELLVRASAGIAAAPAHGQDAETLMKNADIALYHAKLERDRISVYSDEYDINTVERLKLLADLRTALDRRELHLVFQPQVDLATGRTVAVEALVRWQHPEHGMIGPDEFIPLAENSGLIFPLTTFVLDDALAELARWTAQGHDVRMAVNLSARHLADLALPGQVLAALDRHDVPASSLVLEVTETGILSDAVRADMVIHALREVGVEIAIDDYGTGNASLSYLKRLEVDELKVDRSFVGNMLQDEHDQVIVRSTIELALALGLRVVAEGIEDEPTVTVLAGLGGVIGQGYHLGRPTTPDEIDVRLAAEAATASSSRNA